MNATARWIAALLVAGSTPAFAQVTLTSGQVWPGMTTMPLDMEGKTTVKLAGEVFGATVGPATIINAFRVVETQDNLAVIRNLHITGINATAVQRECIRLRGSVTNVMINGVNCAMRDTPQTSPNLPEGIHLEAGDGITIQNSSFNGFRMTAGPDSYWNGDGIAAERGVTDLRIINVSADDNSDAGFDLKSTNTWLDGVSAKNNTRNYRFWDAISIGTITVGDTLRRGGTASTAGIWIKGSVAMPVVEIAKLVIRMSRPGPIFRIEQGPVDLRIGFCDIEAPPGTIFIVSESANTKTSLGPGCPA